MFEVTVLVQYMWSILIGLCQLSHVRETTRTVAIYEVSLLFMVHFTIQLNVCWLIEVYVD